MLRRPKHSTIKVVAPKEEEEEVLGGDLNSQTGRANTNEASSTCHFYEKSGRTLQYKGMSLIMRKALSTPFSII